jgi:hypothetical protein
MPVKKRAATARRTSSLGKKDVSASYNRYKFYRGKQYTGMKVGGTHKWYYDKGVWRDKKTGPDDWEISYAVTKRRAGHAPEGSGAAVGTEYHWYILAHQLVKKLNANDYSTEMTGFKYKLAHKRAATGKWSVSQATQRKKLVKVLKDLIARIEKGEVPFPMESGQLDEKKTKKKKTAFPLDKEGQKAVRKRERVLA